MAYFGDGFGVAFDRAIATLSRDFAGRIPGHVHLDNGWHCMLRPRSARQEAALRWNASPCRRDSTVLYHAGNRCANSLSAGRSGSPSA
jgi:hypothetical protein